MRKFVYLIGTTDDFESIEDLVNAYTNADTDRNMSVFPVEISEDCQVVGYERIEDIATILGRGEAMSNDWCLDGTLSCLLEA